MAEIDTNIEKVNGNMIISGNLQVDSQITTNELQVKDGKYNSIISTSGDTITFKKSCQFTKPVEFEGGALIGVESTYNSACVNAATISAGKRFVLADSPFRINGNTNDNPRQILADTFKMTLKSLDVTSLLVKNISTTENIKTEKLLVNDELNAKTIFAGTIQTSNFYYENINGISMKASDSLETEKNLIVGGSAVVETGMTINGTGIGNGSALTVNGGEIVANKGIVSNTRNNYFQCLQITGGLGDHDQCFKISKNVDSLIEGDVTIQDSNLILDNSQLVSDNITVSPLNEVNENNIVSGVQITTKGDWDGYISNMVTNYDFQDVSEESKETYDPYEYVSEAIERNDNNYRSSEMAVKSILNPINYAMEKGNPNLPPKFNVKSGKYRIDSNGNALFRNIVSEKGRFSSLDVYNLNANIINLDKVVATGVGSNVVQADQLLKCSGITELDGSVNAKANIFLESDSTMNVNRNASVTFKSGSSLVLQNGATFTMGSQTSMKMEGSVELDLSKLVFHDPTTNRNFQISFRDAHDSEGSGIVMEYKKIDDSNQVDDDVIVDETKLSATELDQKLKSLGL